MGFAVYWVAYFIVEVIGVQAALIASYALYANYQSNYAAHRARRLAAAVSVEGRSTMVRQPITVRKTIYGLCKVSGPITFMHVSAAKNLYILITISGHEVHSIDDIYFNDDLVDMDSAGTVIGKYAGNAVIKKGLGSTAGDADLHAFLISECPDKWTANHLQSGCAKILVRLSPNRDVYSSGVPNISAVTRGKNVYDPRTTTTSYSPNAALCIRDYLTISLKTASGRIDDTAKITAANVSDEQVDVAVQENTFVPVTSADPYSPCSFDYNIVAGSLSGSSSYQYRYTYYDGAGESAGSPISDIFYGQGYDVIGVSLINISVGPYGITGRKIYRSIDGGGFFLAGTIANNTATDFDDDGSTTGAAMPSSNTLTVSDTIERNSGLPTLMDGDPVVLTTTGTLPAPLAISTTYYFIYVSKLRGKLATTRANAMSGTAIDITTTGSGTHTIVRTHESRYAMHGTVDSDIEPKTAIESMLTSCAGKLPNIGGKWTLLVGAYRSPTLTFDEDDLDGQIKTTSLISKRELSNRVKGVYIDPEKDWQPTDFPPVTNATYLAEDDDTPLWRDIELSFTSSPSAAQRIAKIELERGRQQIATMWPCKLHALRAQVGDVVNLTNLRYGWSGKPFEINDLQFAVRMDGDVPRLGVDLTLRETASGVYDWNSGEETVIDLSPNTNLPNPLDVDPPANLHAESGNPDSLILRQDGTIFTRAKLIWDAITDGNVSNGGYIEVQYRRAASTSPDWENSPIVPGSDSATYILDVEDGALYIFRARAVNNLGFKSSWASYQHVIIGKTAPPADVTGLYINNTLLGWTPSTEADRKGYIVRYRTDGGTTWVTATPAHGTAYITDAQFDTRYLVGNVVKMLVKAIDTTDHESANPASFDVELRPGTPTQFNITRQPDGTREFTFGISPIPDDLRGFLIRYYNGSTSDWSAMSQLHTGVLMASPFETNQLPSGTYTFACKAIDLAGNESAAATFITSVAIGDPRLAGAFEDVNEITENWSGTKTDCYVDDTTGWLVADGTGTWTSLPATWTDWTSWNDSPVSPIEYIREIDIGVVTTFSVVIIAESDGTQTITESHSDDGSSWSSYAAIGLEITARYIRIKMSVAGAYPILKSMRSMLIGNAVTDYINDLDISTLSGSYRIGVGNVRIPISKPFTIIKKVGVSLQNVSAGWSWVLIDKDTTYGPQIKVYDQTDTLADCVIDADIDGII